MEELTVVEYDGLTGQTTIRQLTDEEIEMQTQLSSADPNQQAPETPTDG